MASTKAFTSQIVALSLLALHLGRLKGTLSKDECRALLESLAKVPQLMEQALAMSGRVEKLSTQLATARDFAGDRRRVGKAWRQQGLGRGAHAAGLEQNGN